ncbi:hypothetical protein AK830_g3587 [Neonectria ditissima]|uniref:Norsolorinic acid ketoreductase n=1 Tax=Neonectria ditissima TaxID=78410 RepID=A0A0P7BPY6_9HYPO|nr:hypothetical protein AK830_g3587 [Neonectria ditissima]
MAPIKHKTIYLITGANRRLGLSFTKTLLARDKTVVIAAVRDTLSPSALAMADIPRGTDSEIITAKIDSLNAASAASAIANLPKSVNHLDVVIANAGVHRHFGPVSAMPIEELPYHIAVNTAAPIVLLQACLPLLKHSSSPKFVVVSSTLGSLAEVDNFPQNAGAYGASKAAVNYLMRKVHYEEPWLASMVICPGWTQTDMGNNGAKQFGFGDSAPLPVDVSTKGVIEELAL